MRMFKGAGKKLKIGLDIDGVLIDHARAKIEKAKALGYRLRLAETPGAVLKRIMSADDYGKLKRYVYGRQVLSAPAVRGSLKGIRFLPKRAEVYIVSRQLNPQYSRQWLRAHLPEFPKRRIFFVRRDQDKGKIAKKLDLDVYLDDSPRVLTMLHSVRYKFLLDEYGIFKRIPSNITIVRSWDAFVRNIGHAKRII